MNSLVRAIASDEGEAFVARLGWEPSSRLFVTRRQHVVAGLLLAIVSAYRCWCLMVLLFINNEQEDTHALAFTRKISCDERNLLIQQALGLD